MIQENLEKGDFKEEDTIQHRFEAMEIGEQEPELLDEGLDEVASCNIF